MVVLVTTTTTTTTSLTNHQRFSVWLCVFKGDNDNLWLSIRNLPNAILLHQQVGRRVMMMMMMMMKVRLLIHCHLCPIATTTAENQCFGPGEASDSSHHHPSPQGSNGPPPHLVVVVVVVVVLMHNEEWCCGFLAQRQHLIS